jgi:hypothetical protein
MTFDFSKVGSDLNCTAGDAYERTPGRNLEQTRVHRAKYRRLIEHLIGLTATPGSAVTGHESHACNEAFSRKIAGISAMRLAATGRRGTR